MVSTNFAFNIFFKYQALILVIIGFFFGAIAPAPGIYLSNLNIGGICLLTSSTNDGNSTSISKNINRCVYDKVSHIPIAVIFLMSGFGLEISQIRSAITNYKAGFGGLLLILFITPLLSILVFTSSILSSSPDFAFGMGIFLLCPTTLATGVATTKVANGNVPLAIILTVASNLIGVITVPFAISSTVPMYHNYLKEIGYNSTFLGDQPINISVDPVPLIVVLFFSIFLPINAGIFLRARFTSISRFASTHKVVFSSLSNTMLGLITWMQCSASSSSILSITFESLLAILFVFAMVHVAFLCINATFARYILCLPAEDFKAVVIMGMQKSLATSLTILPMLPPNVTPSIGLAPIPIIICQLFQTIFDSTVAVMMSKSNVSQVRS